MDANLTRRRMLTATLGASGPLALPRFAPGSLGRATIRETPFAERHFRNPSGPSSPGITLLSCRVEIHDDVGSATKAFDRLYADATSTEEEQFMELSYSDIEEYDLPLDMIEDSHRFATYSTVAGAAGFRSDHAVGVVRRGRIVWLYVTQGQGREAIGGIAAAMVEREIGADAVTVDERGQRHGALWDLLPALDDVPPGLVLVADESLAGTFNALGTPLPTPDS